MSTENIRKRSNSEKDSTNVSSDHVNDEHCNEDEELDFFDFIEVITDEIDTMASQST
jgi:hypothetical protein